MSKQWDDASSVDDLTAALAERRFQDGEHLVRAFLADIDATQRRVSEAVATGVLKALRGHLWFAPLDSVARALERCGQEAPEVRRQLAQARIEQGRATEAIDGLLQLLAELDEAHGQPELDPMTKEGLEWELGESLGLLGRAYKQLYVDAKPRSGEPREHDLKLARDYYHRAYEKRWGDYLWHGVNDVALVTHAERVRRGKANVYPAVDQAEKILAKIEALGRRRPLEPWDLANRTEALVASGRFPEAVEAVEAYLDCSGLNAFNIHSTRRQLRDLYLLDEHSPPGDKILPMMTAKMAALGGGVESIDLSPVRSKQYERVFGNVSYKPLDWLRLGIERAQCVARLGPTKFEGEGTGFLFDGALIGEKHAGRHLMLTNSHVCSPDAKVQRGYPWPKDPSSLIATFLAARKEGEPVGVGVKGALWSSPPTELDATLVELAGNPPKGALPPPRAEGPPDPSAEDGRVNVVGHPKGMDVRVSLQDNQVVAVGDPFIQYRTPTDPGSSGSPVFNQAWELVALHHAGDTGAGANEGVLLDPLLIAMRKALA